MVDFGRQLFELKLAQLADSFTTRGWEGTFAFPPEQTLWSTRIKESQLQRNGKSFHPLCLCHPRSSFAALGFRLPPNRPCGLVPRTFRAVSGLSAGRGFFKSFGPRPGSPLDVQPTDL